MDKESFFNRLLMEKVRQLHLTVGGRVIKCCFVGFKPREYLIIEVPGSAEIDGAFTGTESVLGSFHTSGTVVRFESSITAHVKSPAWLLFVAYPSSLSEIKDLRSAYRSECSIPCTLVTLFNLNQYEGLIVDINSGGCRCVPSSISHNRAELLYNSEKKVLLEFELPGSYGRKRVFGEVASVRRDGAEISFGIRFNDHDDEKALRELEDYVSNVVKLPS